MLAIWRDIRCDLAALLIESAIRGFRAVDRVAVRKVTGRSHTPSVPAARRARGILFCVLGRDLLPLCDTGYGNLRLSDLRVRLRKLLGRTRAPLESFSDPPDPSLRFPCFLTHACGLPYVVSDPSRRTRFINILNKIWENLNSSCGKGRKGIVERRGKKGDARSDLYIYHETMSMHFHRY